MIWKNDNAMHQIGKQKQKKRNRIFTLNSNVFDVNLSQYIDKAFIKEIIGLNKIKWLTHFDFRRYACNKKKLQKCSYQSSR